MRSALPLWSAVFLGGCVGALGRAALVEVADVEPGSWPWATFLANVAGCALLGYAGARLRPSTLGRAFLGPGVCGALTTFSALQLELVELARGGHASLAVAYLLASLLAGFAAVVLGTRRARLR